MSIRYETGAPTTLATAQISALGNGTGATGSAFPNGGSANLWLRGDWQFSGQFGTTPLSGSAIELYILPTIDGTTFAEGNSAIHPPGLFAGAFTIRAVTTLQILSLTGITLPPVNFMPLLVNRGGQTFSGNNFLSLIPSRYQ